MKKVLSYILISFVIFANLFAPIGVALDNGNIEIKKNEVSAGNSLGIKMSSTPTVYDTQIKVDINITWMAYDGMSGTSEGVRVTIKDPSGVEKDREKIVDLSSTNIKNNQVGSYTFTGLTPNKGYNIITEARQIDMTIWSANDDLRVWWATLAPNALGLWIMSDQMIAETIANKGLGVLILSDFKTTTPDTKTIIVGDATTGQNSQFTENEVLPACDITGSGDEFVGCIAQGFYYVLFVPTSYLFALAGTIFDYTFAYSVQDSSYRSAFVVQGWGLIRDFCNIFFIFVMLYIAISTILSLHGFKTKETIINVIIIGLFINFSLFATQVIIDASNITARVFYNSDAIKITEKGVTGATNVVSKIGADGVIPISAALVNKVNPQNMIINAKQINNIPNASHQGLSGVDSGSTAGGIGPGQFILIVIMASAINIVGLTVFFTVAFLFLGRVVGLWLAMILSPLAFFTYILPQLEGVKMIGWKNWWQDTLKLAFLAPVFMFFMYLILKFLSMDLIADNVGKSITGSGLSYFASLLIPFAFIMIFMIKAKNIAVGMSGEFGEMATKLGSSVGGMVLGGAVGAGAVAMRGTVGRLGNYVANNATVQERAARKGFVGMINRGLFTSGKKTSTASFDARNTKLGGMAGGAMKVDMGKAKEGGFAKLRADKTAERQKRAKDLELTVDSPQRKELMRKQMEQKRLEDTFSGPIHKIDGDLAAAKNRFSEAASGSEEQKKEAEEIRRLNEQKGEYTKGGAVRDEITGKVTGYNTNNGNISQTTVDTAVANLKKANESMVEALASQTTVSKAATNATNQVTNAKDSLKNAETDWSTAQDTAKKAAAAAAAKPGNVGLAISNTNASAALAAAANKLDKAKADVTVAETTESNAIAAVTNAGAKVDAATKILEKARAENQEAEDSVAAATAPGGKGLGRSINDLKFHDIPHDDIAINKRNNAVRNDLADLYGSGVNKTLNFLASGGQHSFAGDNEAEYNVRMAIASSGGGHAAPATPKQTAAPAQKTSTAGAGTHTPSPAQNH